VAGQTPRPGRRRPLVALAALLAAAATAIAPAASLAAAGVGFPDTPVDSPLGAVPAGHERQPQVRSPEAIVIDATTGTVLYAKNPAGRRPIASTTKLMTALIALQSTRPDQVMTAQPYPATPSESTLGLRPGERMTVRDLLHALLLASANDAAATLADGISGSEKAFVARMNAEARRLGLRDTRYANPVGLDDPNGYSSARDLATLSRRLMRDPRFASIVDMSQDRLTSGSHPRKIVNRNDLVGTHRFVDGVKTGHTSHAGYILVGAGHRDGARVISVVLDEPSQAARDSETLALLRYGLGRFAHVTIHSRTIKLVNIKNYDLRAPLRPGHDLTAAVLPGSSLRLRIYPPIIVRGPLPAGYVVGSVSLYADDHPVTRAPLVTAEHVPGASLGRVILIKLSNGDAALGCGVLGIAVLLALRLSRGPMLTRGRTFR
jgi:serine-type D-Ala-D-Ala carboxypeptidase (penicillin-binding protein 5/6)